MVANQRDQRLLCHVDVETSLRTTTYQLNGVELRIRVVVDQNPVVSRKECSMKGVRDARLVNENASRARCKSETSFIP